MAALAEALKPWKCCGAPNLCGAACQDDELSATLAKAYALVAHESQCCRASSTKATSYLTEERRHDIPAWTPQVGGEVADAE